MDELDKPQGLPLMLVTESSSPFAPHSARLCCEESKHLHPPCLTQNRMNICTWKIAAQTPMPTAQMVAKMNDNNTSVYPVKFFFFIQTCFSQKWESSPTTNQAILNLHFRMRGSASGLRASLKNHTELTNLQKKTFFKFREKKGGKTQYR